MIEAERCHWEKENIIICDSPLRLALDELAQFLLGGGLIVGISKDSASTRNLTVLPPFEWQFRSFFAY